MLAPSVVRSIDALIADDPGALENAELKTNLLDFAVARARLDAAELATIHEFNMRGLFVTDGMVNTPAWLAHQTGVSRAVAGSRFARAKELRYMPMFAAALAAGQITEMHVKVMGHRLS